MEKKTEMTKKLKKINVVTSEENNATLMGCSCSCYCGPNTEHSASQFNTGSNIENNQ